MSKRKGAASVEEYRDMGYLPETMCNYLLKLGWGHGDDEIISREQAIEWFDLDGIVKSPARWDFDKLNHLNAHYIKQAENKRLLELSKSFLGFTPDVTGEQRLLAMMDELKSRAVTVKQIADEGAFLAKTVPLDFSDEAKKLLDEESKKTLAAVAIAFSKIESFYAANIEESCRALATELGLKLGKVMMPLRAALTGRDKSPSLFHAIEVLGKQETINRINAAKE
jgi:glutamyl-tRNA synthetase